MSGPGKQASSLGGTAGSDPAETVVRATLSGPFSPGRQPELIYLRLFARFSTIVMPFSTPATVSLLTLALPVSIRGGGVT